MEPNFSTLITTAEAGDPVAAEALFSALYDELHRLARAQLARNAGAVTIGTTSLLHAAYLGIAEREGLHFPDRARFMAYASRAMRGLIIDAVRRRRAQKRGGLFELTAIESDVADPAANPDHLEAIGEALDALSVVDPALVRVVDLKFFCGFSFGEIAVMTGQSERTVQRQWEKARIFLHRALAPER